MALFFECMRSCARKVLDTADIVRDGIFHQSSSHGSVHLTFRGRMAPLGSAGLPFVNFFLTIPSTRGSMAALALLG